MSWLMDQVCVLQLPSVPAKRHGRAFFDFAKRDS
jgi:hypothetical protein